VSDPTDRGAAREPSQPSRLALRGVSKRFGAVTALAPLTLELPAGSVHGVLGENGAGKSTLVRLIAGALRPDTGRIEVDGQPIPVGDPRRARAAGIGVVHQHFALVGALSVAENLRLGRPELRSGLLSPTRLAAEARDLEARFGLTLGDPRRRCDELPIGVQARVEIVRALSGAPRILLLDEPTAVLTPPEIAELFATIRRLKAAGLLVLFITHKLEEALTLCDAITVLRAGRRIATVAAADLGAAELARLMIGPTPPDGVAPVTATDSRPTRVAAGRAAATRMAHATPALEVRDVSTGGERERVALDGISFQLDAGEICGIAGVDGNGQVELAGALYGLIPRRGTVAVAGRNVPARDVGAAQRAGLALIPADRRRDGLAARLPVWENALAVRPLLARFTRHGILDVAAARTFAAELARAYRVVLASVDQPIGTLSGGNQQRLVIGRALALAPDVLLAVNPTRGLDVAATVHVHATLRGAADAGAAILLVSTELDELLALCSRLFAIYRGRLAGPVAPAERERLGAMMAGLAA
jgi:simple sugar transport system ATP-binding protein